MRLRGMEGKTMYDRHEVLVGVFGMIILLVVFVLLVEGFFRGDALFCCAAGLFANALRQ